MPKGTVFPSSPSITTLVMLLSDKALLVLLSASVCVSITKAYPVITVPFTANAYFTFLSTPFSFLVKAVAILSAVMVSFISIDKFHLPFIETARGAVDSASCGVATTLTGAALPSTSTKVNSCAPKSQDLGETSATSTRLLN